MTDLTIRASSFSTLADCPARWKAVHLDGMKSRTSGAAVLGTALHEATAAYDEAIMSDDPISPEDAADVLVDFINTSVDVVWDNWSPKTAIRTGLRLLSMYTLDVAHKFNWVAVEAELPDLEFEWDNGVKVRLTGHLDRIFELSLGVLGVLDNKSGARVLDAHGNVKAWLHRDQLGCYEILAEQEWGPMTATARILGFPTMSQNPQLVIGEIAGGRDHLVHEKGPIAAACMYLERDLWPGNPQSSLCSKKWCPAWKGCRWRV